MDCTATLLLKSLFRTFRSGKYSDPETNADPYPNTTPNTNFHYRKSLVSSTCTRATIQLTPVSE